MPRAGASPKGTCSRRRRWNGSGAIYETDPADRRDWRFSPLHAPDLAGVAPALLLLAEYDPLLDEGLAYGRRLQAAGVRSRSTSAPA